MIVQPQLGGVLAAATSEASPAMALLEIGAVLFGLGLAGLVAHRTQVSPIPLYLLTGLAFGNGGLAPLGASEQFIAVGAEIGAVLLLLSLGLEYAADELAAALRHNAPAGMVDLVLNALPGAALALFLGWGPVAAVALAGVTYISSSGIVAKLLADLGRLGNRETPVVLSVLVFEDLVMAVYLPILAALIAGLGILAATTSVATALVAVAGVFAVALRFPGALARLVFAPDDEVMLLRLLGLTLLVAGLAAQLNVSATVGAFLVGLSLSGSVAHGAGELLRPLRDLFAAVFFVFFGLQIDPNTLPGVLLPALALALVTTLTKVATGWWAAARVGIARPGRLRAGTALIPRGEFSIVIAGLATASVAVPDRFGPLAAAYVLILAVAGPVLVRITRPPRTLTGTAGKRTSSRHKSSDA